jgi:two-component system, NarL family, invasion response regulator UvrY
VIADDHPIVREGLKSVIAQHPDIEVLGEAGDGDQAIDVCAALRPDVLLLDVGMPGPGVLEVVRRLKAVHQGAMRILVLSVHPEEHYARRVLMAGADGYVTKSNSPDVLYEAIRTVASGRKYLSPRIVAESAPEGWLAQDGNPHEALSNREYEVFVSLGSGRSVDETATALGIKPKTVRSYRSRIIEKTNFRTTAEMIFYAVSHGLVERAASRDLGPRRPRVAKKR